MTETHLHSQPVATTVGSFLANLPEMLGAMAVDPAVLIAICEFSDGRYVQFWVDSPEYFVAEVLSNMNIGTAEALTPENELDLLADGWQAPDAEGRPNYWLEGHSVADLIDIVRKMNSAVRNVLGERPENVVSIRQFPASDQITRHADRQSVRTYEVEDEE